MSSLRFNTIQSLKAHAFALWYMACASDGIPADSMFVVFSESNPVIPAYNAAVKRYLAVVR